MPTLLAGAAALMFVASALCLIVMADRRRRRHDGRLARICADDRTPRSAAPIAPRARKSATREASPLLTRIEQQLAQTNLRTSVSELLLQVSLGTLSLYALAVLVGHFHPVIALPIAIVIPPAVAVLVLRMAKARYRAAFTADLPEALDVFARGLRAGRPVSASLEIVVKNAKGPIQREFTICHDEISMGTSLAESLSRLEERMPTAEVSFFSVATSLQAETGGNLIETMESLASQLRERRKLRKKARALSSEARASAVILASLPFAITLVLFLLNADYLAPLWTDGRGRVMAAVALVSIGLGIFSMTRMGRLDV